MYVVTHPALLLNISSVINFLMSDRQSWLWVEWWTGHLLKASSQVTHFIFMPSGERERERESTAIFHDAESWTLCLSHRSPFTSSGLFIICCSSNTFHSNYSVHCHNYCWQNPMYGSLSKCCNWDIFHLFMVHLVILSVSTVSYVRASGKEVVMAYFGKFQYIHGGTKGKLQKASVSMAVPEKIWTWYLPIINKKHYHIRQLVLCNGVSSLGALIVILNTSSSCSYHKQWQVYRGWTK
jgi:hypothetical protein